MGLQTGSAAADAPPVTVCVCDIRQVVGSEERKRTLTPLALRERYSVLNEPGQGESRSAPASVCCTEPLPTILSFPFDLARMAHR